VESKRTQLVSTKKNSRLKKPQMRRVEKRPSSSRVIISPKEAAPNPMKMTKAQNSPLSSPKECTERTMPDRVMKVPRMVSQKVSSTRNTVQPRSRPPRRRDARAAWSSAVAVSQGNRDAFSMGSQPHQPPQSMSP